jgi:hypothetical protein
MWIRGRNGDCEDVGALRRVRLKLVAGEDEEERVAAHVC